MYIYSIYREYIDLFAWNSADKGNKIKPEIEIYNRLAARSPDRPSTGGLTDGSRRAIE